MRFSLFGIPVEVRPTFWLIVALLGLPSSWDRDGVAQLVTWVAIVFVSVLVHELGHALAMRRLGRTPRIELWQLGGLTHWGEGPRVAGWKRAAVSLAGPFAGFALAMPFVIASASGRVQDGTLAAEVVEQALWVNVGWGLVNLLPILPLDGGHVMEVALGGIAGERGPRLAVVLSIAFAVGAAALAMAYQMPWAAFLAFFAGMQNVSRLRGPVSDASIPARATIDPGIASALDEAWSAVRAGRAGEAIAACESVLVSLPEDEAHAAIRARAIETIAWAHLEDGEEKEALAAARRMPPRFTPSALLAARLLLAEGKYDEGMRALERAYQDTPGDLPGLVLASVYVDQRRPERAVSMLRGLRGARLTSSAHLTISAALFYAEHHEDALAVSELAWNRFHEPTHAYNAACSCARLGRVEPGLDWLEKSVEAGFDRRAELERDADLDPLRAEPRFARIVARIRREPEREQTE